ncbi:MAG: transcriptional repressor [Clostridia bacterium]|nr:transcriptional repressor [Clostridia bacterium]
MEKKTYKTTGRARIGSFFAKNPDRQFTTEEICRAINGSDVGRSSVYRHLSELCEADVIRKFHSASRNCSVYQYVGAACDCRDHFHGKCIVCGTIEHLGCHDSAHFAGHLLEEHGFAVDCGRSILYGVCARCRALKEREEND